MRPGFLAPFSASSSIVGVDVATGSSLADTPVKLTLRAKGILAFVLLIVYIAIFEGVVGQQWHKSLVLAGQLEQLDTRERKVDLLESALSHALLEVQARSFYADQAEASKMFLDIELIRRNAENLTQYYPKLVPIHERVRRNLAELLAAPARESFVTLRQSMNDMSAQINNISEEVHGAREAVANASRQLSERIVLIAVTMGLLGAVAFGAVVTLFFSGLARDVRKLEARAVDVVGGYSGAPLEITRHDEVGGLMHAVNRMQRELRHREQQLELSRQQRFHHEKMAAIGSLAAAVAHEINNPIAAITGIAQAISDAKQTHLCPYAEMIGCYPELILEHAKRVASITRQVAELTAAHPPEPELLDLNALVTNTCNFISYDQRFRGIDLVIEPDHDLPAIEAVADHLTQVLMNLLINAADALQGVTDRKPTIRVVTRTADGGVLIEVSDNGCGMDRAVLSRAFDDSFTTKPVGKGCGLGLFLCKTLVEQRGGRIELESTPGVGTTAQIWLPLEHQQRIAA